MGDWVGQLVPDSAGRLTQNVYLRFAADQLVEAADSAGNEWTLVNSDREFDFSSGGALEAEMAWLVGASSLAIQAQMDAARTVLTGTYVQVGGDLFPVPGTITLTRSAAGAFTSALLEGDWAGTGTRVTGEGLVLEFSIGPGGDLLAGRIKRRNGTIRRSYLPAAGSFAFFDDAIGRLQDVVLVGDNGKVSTFHYLLVDVDGTLLAGIGTDEVFGAGLIRLEPAVAD